jgi:carboxyl-terminal processing protease
VLGQILYHTNSGRSIFRRIPEIKSLSMNHPRIQYLWTRFILWLSVILFFWTTTTPAALAFTQEQQLFNEAWRIVNQSYVDGTFNHQNWWKLRETTLKKPLNDRNATYDAVRNALASLDDPFTRLLPPAQYRSLRASTSGELSGVGLQITANPQTGILEVIAPIEGSPAALAGIQPHDQILQIDHTPAQELSLDEAAERMRGAVGTSVLLQVQAQHSGAPSLIQEISLQRQHIELKAVRGEVRPLPQKTRQLSTEQGEGIGYIRLSQFNANATREMVETLRQLEKQRVQGYILDLRNNPGGLLQAGIEIANLWMEANPIVYTVDRGGLMGSYSADGSPLTQAPLVVLVNHGSASASEILAGALQDTSRAILIGEQTFGKGSIQSLFDLSDGAGLAVTIARYETPNHRSINKIGITPDRVVESEQLAFDEFGSDRDRQYQVALETLATQFLSQKFAKV